MKNHNFFLFITLISNQKYFKYIWRISNRNNITCICIKTCKLVYTCTYLCLHITVFAIHMGLFLTKCLKWAKKCHREIL